MKRTITTTYNQKGPKRASKKAYTKKDAMKVFKRIPYGMPPTNMIKLKFATSVNLNPAAGIMTSHYFSANGMQDPDISGFGHQPLFFDQYMASYDQYRVVGSSIKVTQLPEATSGSVTPVLWGVILDDNTSLTYTTASALIESNQSKGVFRIGSQVSTAAHEAGKEPSLVCNFSAKKHFGDLNSTHDGTKSTNPTDQAYYGLWCTGVGGVGDPPTMTFMVEISYVAIIKEPHFVAQS